MEKHVTNDELLMLTQKAFERDEVADFLQGKNGYACPVNRFVPANVPTDMGRILEFGIYVFYSETNDETIIQKLKETIFELLKGDSIQVWCAYRACWSQIYKGQNNKAPFELIDKSLLDALRQALLKDEDKLRACKEWQGWNKENGLWDDICRTNWVLNDVFNVSIL